VNETETGDRSLAPSQGNGDNIPSTVSTISQTQANTKTGISLGGQNGNRFGSNRP
jgi:hypothetical protein